MEEEILDILDASGKPTGENCLITEAHKKGYYHNTAHIWFYTKDGHILLSQRAATKSIYPLLWDVSVAGHVDSGESITQAAIREAQEEIGLTLSENDLQKIGIFECFQSYENGIIDNEFHHTFISELTVTVSQLRPQIKEVEALKLVSIKEFRELLQHSETNSHFLKTNTSYYEFVIENIQKQLKFS
jgi:isopentenyldiphosphate isomerase